MIDVSVILPTLNRPAELNIALASALRQRVVDFEVIIIDDGSDADLAPQHADRRTTVLRHPGRRGVSAARNTGIVHAQGKWIAFLDDDDLWAPDKLVRQLEVAEASSRNWAYAGYVDVDSHLTLVGGVPPPSPEVVMGSLTCHNSVPAGGSNVVVRADMLAEAGLFDEQMSVHEDWDMWLRLGRQGPPACVPEPLVALRGRCMRTYSEMQGMLDQLPRVARRHGIEVDYARHMRWAAWVALTSGRRAEAVHRYMSAALAGDVFSLARAAAIAATPRTVLRRQQRTVLSDWALGADEWLCGMR